jgi:multiple sugar transport system substrate-binding protein
MKKQLYLAATLLIAISILLPACGNVVTNNVSTTATQAPTTATQVPTISSQTQTALATGTPNYSGEIPIRWDVGIGDGSDPTQVTIENDVVNDFNASQSKIHLVIEVIPNASANDTFSTEVASGSAPDIIGPINWFASNSFYGQWLDLAPYIKSTNYDMSKFDPAMAASYQTDQGTVGLPFAVYPSAIFYNTDLFNIAHLNPLPAKYGDQYKMPDGSMVDWTWENLAKIAKLLTIDSAGKHSGEAGFNSAKIVQYGFSFGWESHPNDWASFMSNGGSILIPGGSKGSYNAKIPDVWKTAWQWVYNGIWGTEPYIPSGTVSNTADFDNGNVFASGKIGMLDNPSVVLCCLGDLTTAGGKFEFGSMPMGLDGKVAGRVDEETFHIWKGTKHPAEAFAVLTYLIDTGIQKLVIGTPIMASAYGDAVPGVVADRAAWLATQQAAFPFVKNWATVLAGLNYPDVPSAEAYMPNINNAWARIQTFGDLLANTKMVDLSAQEATLELDLNAIFNK